MGSSRRSAVAGLAAALLLFVGCMGVLVVGSVGQGKTGSVQTTDNRAVNSVVPRQAVQHGDGAVELALSH